METAAMAATVRSTLAAAGAQQQLTRRAAGGRDHTQLLSSRVALRRDSALVSKGAVSCSSSRENARVGAVEVRAVNSSSTAVATPTSAGSEKSLAKPTVLVAEKLGAAGLELLEKVAIVDCSYNLSQEDLCAKISQCDALIVRSGTKVTKEVFEASKGRLKVFFSFTILRISIL